MIFQELQNHSGHASFNQSHKICVRIGQFSWDCTFQNYFFFFFLKASNSYLLKLNRKENSSFSAENRFKFLSPPQPGSCLRSPKVRNSNTPSVWFAAPAARSAPASERGSGHLLHGLESWGETGRGLFSAQKMLRLLGLFNPLCSSCACPELSSAMAHSTLQGTNDCEIPQHSSGKGAAKARLDGAGTWKVSLPTVGVALDGL